MAQRVQVLLVDDIDGAVAAETVSFSLDGVSYEIDLTASHAKKMRDDVLVMHPGPMNRGVEIGAHVPDRENTVITQQVANGVAVRMAVLFELLTGGAS